MKILFESLMILRAKQSIVSMLLTIEKTHVAKQLYSTLNEAMRVVSEVYFLRIAIVLSQL